MSEQSSPTQSLDLTQGIALDKVADGEMLLGHVGKHPSCWCIALETYLPLARPAPTMAHLWSMVCWSMIPSVVRGITPVSAFVPVRRCVPRH